MGYTDIKNYEGRYLITEYGKIYSLKRHRPIKPFKSKHGYMRVQLSKNNTQKNYFVHRLIAMTFIDNPENKKFVNHIDGDKLNNVSGNLEWCTSSENELHSYRALGKVCYAKGRFGKDHPASIRVLALLSNGWELVFNSRNKAAEVLGVDPTSISKVLKGKHKTAGGIKFRYT